VRRTIACALSEVWGASIHWQQVSATIAEQDSQDPPQVRLSRFRRHRELTALGGDRGRERPRRRWQQAKLSEGRVVLFAGEPGIGKSRIAESLLARIEGEPHVRPRRTLLQR